MGERYYGLYDAIIDATQSEVILFFVIVAIVMAVVVAPLYVAVLRDRKGARHHEREREKLVIDVIKGSSSAIAENSAVISSLKTTLDNNNNTFVKALDRVHTRIDEQCTIANETTKAIFTEIAQLNTRITGFTATSLENQREMSSKINKILIVASGGKMPPE